MLPTARTGICALTRNEGVYVDSHLIPRALTRLSGTGAKFVETGIGYKTKMRANSWYDAKLVTRAGEDILSDIDAKGIEMLREHRLVWSSWGNERRLEGCELLGSDVFYRTIAIENADVLRLFFLSLLWRAAASTRPEFVDVELSEDDLEDVRVRVLGKDPGPVQDYPVQLFQLITRGHPHNRTPLLERKSIVTLDRSVGPEVRYARFYFDGLVSHIHLSRNVALHEDYLATCLGFGSSTIIFGHEFESSRTNDNIQEMVAGVHRQQFVVVETLNPVVAAIRERWPDAKP